MRFILVLLQQNIIKWLLTRKSEKVNVLKENRIYSATQCAYNIDIV
jgi:hypothetical protein